LRSAAPADSRAFAVSAAGGAPSRHPQEFEWPTRPGVAERCAGESSQATVFYLFIQLTYSKDIQGSCLRHIMTVTFLLGPSCHACHGLWRAARNLFGVFEMLLERYAEQPLVPFPSNLAYNFHFLKIIELIVWGCA